MFLNYVQIKLHSEHRCSWSQDDWAKNESFLFVWKESTLLPASTQDSWLIRLSPQARHLTPACSKMCRVVQSSCEQKLWAQSYTVIKLTPTDSNTKKYAVHLIQGLTNLDQKSLFNQVDVPRHHGILKRRGGYVVKAFTECKGLSSTPRIVKLPMFLPLSKSFSLNCSYNWSFHVMFYLQASRFHRPALCLYDLWCLRRWLWILVILAYFGA